MVLFAFSVQKTFAQALKFSFLSYEKTSVGQEVPFLFGWGYEHNLSDRVAIGFEMYTPWTGTENYLVDQNGETYMQGEGFTMQGNYKYKSFVYNARYFFSDNDEGAGYFGTQIGLRATEYTYSVNVDYPYNPPAGVFDVDNKIEKITTYPLSMRIGYRNSIDGLYGDYFIALNYNIGADKKLNNAAANIIRPELMKPLTITFGFFIGFGFVD